MSIRRAFHLASIGAGLIIVGVVVSRAIRFWLKFSWFHREAAILNGYLLLGWILVAVIQCSTEKKLNAYTVITMCIMVFLFVFLVADLLILIWPKYLF